MLVSCVTQVGDSLAVDLPHDTHNHVAAAEIEQDLRHPEATPGCGDGQGKACTCATVLDAETRLTCWCGGRMHMKHGGSCSKSCSKTVAARKVMRLFRPMKTGRRCVCARACAPVRVRPCVCVWLCGQGWFCACAWLCVFAWVHACLHTCAHDRTPTRCGVKSSSRRRIGLRRAIY